MELSELFGRADLREFDAHTSNQSSPMFATTPSWSDGYSNGADDTTFDPLQPLNYSNLQASINPTNAAELVSYVGTQSTRDLYENATMYILQSNNMQ